MMILITAKMMYVCVSLSLSSSPTPPSSISGLHRLWECMHLPDEDVYGEIMQQADVSALRLFEALVVTLPETVLQTYVLICTDIGIKSPGKGRDWKGEYMKYVCQHDKV